MIAHLPMIRSRRAHIEVQKLFNGVASNEKIESRLEVVVVEVSMDMWVVADVGTRVEVNVVSHTGRTTAVNCRVEVGF